MRESRKKKRIIDLPRFDRPREKMIANGRSNSSTAELLAILFNTGSKKNSALSLGETVLRKFTLEKLPQITIDQLTSIPGIGASKATRLLAAIELGQRMFDAPSLSKIVIHNLQDTVHLLKEYADKRQEYLICLYINARHELIQKEVLGVGNLNTLRIEPREIFRPALSSPCAGVILAHNHPSGDPTPSEDDIAFTKRIHEAGQIMGIPLLDHVIIGSKKYFSFVEYREK